MRRIFTIILSTLLQAAVMTSFAFNLQLTVTPEGAGSVYPNKGSYEEGHKVNISTSPQSGFVFLGWYEGDRLLSSSSSLSYTMPAHDVVLTAHYEFDPNVPADPDSIATEYSVRVLARPEGGGSFNLNDTKDKEGSALHLYAYTNRGFVFHHWENEKGRILSTNQDFNYVIPHGNSTLFGVFDFDPIPPENPGRNAWNSVTGEVVIDDFTTGRLSDAIYDAIDGSNNNDVVSIIISGQMSSYDFGFVNYFDNCTSFDMSRVTGVTEIPSWAFDYSALENVTLPECIELIGSYAFYGCKNLTTLTLLSINPPTLERNVFYDVPEGLTVYVPTFALERYINDPNWQNFTILPSDGNAKNVTITLPHGTDVADYANMKLQLTNADNGQSLSYSTTNKPSYTFNGIQTQTRWIVTLSNQRGDEFGRIENVSVNEDDVAVTFTSLKKAKTVRLSVFTPDGSDITGNAIVSWFSNEGAFIAEGTRLSSVPVGTNLLYSIKLTGNLRYEYQELQQNILVVGDDNAQAFVTLKPIPMVNLTGCVKSEYGTLSGAEIALTQWANGQYSNTTMAKTAQDGTFAFNVLDDSTKLVVSMPHFRDVVIQRAHFGADTDLGTLAMDRVTGIVVLANTRTQNVGSENTFPTVTGSVSYSLFNNTTGRQVEDLVVQGRSIIIPSEAKAGDKMTLAVTELSGNYQSATTDFTISGNDTAKVQLILQELGGIESSFIQSANSENEVLLYDSDGNLQSHTDYLSKKATFSHLTAGTYTLVAIGKSLQRGYMLRLSDLGKTGMKDQSDYVMKQVTVRNGDTETQVFANIPLYDESRFSYTNNDSYVQVNKLSVTTGQYVTISCRAYFKEEYDSAIDNITLIVDLPKDCQLIENSLIVGNAVSPYTVEDGRVFVPLTREQRAERIRLCVVPVAGGTYSLSASVLFDYDGERTQLLGSAYFQTSSMTISVPSSTCQKSVLVSGKAPRLASVEVFDNGILVAQADALKNGQWKVNCPLTDVYNLSEHRISAKIHEDGGLVLQTESKTVIYDCEAVEPLDVTMTFYNAWMKKNISVFFNLKAGSASPTSYSFYHTTPITFVANLSNNTPSAVNSVYIHVYTNDKGVTTLRASYDTNLNKWVAVQEFSPGHLPVSVSVSVDYNSSLAFDEEYANAVVDSVATELNQFQLQGQLIEELYKELEKEIDKGLPDRNLIQTLVETIIEKENNLYGYSDVSPSTDISIRVDNATSYKEILEILSELSDNQTFDEHQSLVDIEMPSIELENGLKTPIIRMHFSNPISSETDAIAIMKNLYTEGFGSQWSLRENELGAITLFSSQGTTFTIDFRELAVVPAEKPDGEAFYEKYAENLTDYMNNLNSWNNKENSNEKMDKAFCQELSNYHYALRALYSCPTIGQSRSSYQLMRRRISKSWIADFRWDKFQKAVKDRWNAVKDDVSNSIDDYKEWNDIISKIDKNCTGGNSDLQEKAKQLRLEQAMNNCLSVGGKVLFRIFEVTGKAIVVGSIETIASNPFAGYTYGITLPYIVCGGVAWWMGDYGGVYLDSKLEKDRKEYNRKMREIKQNMERDCCPNGKCDPDPDPDPDPEPPIPPVQPILDPSGFVYEGVTSNRLQGVTATVFYKEQTEDMYGDVQESIVKWNAEDYGQVNPQITDEEGKYAWDVPQGQWQVKFEKEGYETTYSEWLPVPPPQLDVNIAMKQNRQPEVKAARAYEDAVEVEFDKYMMPELLVSENITVMQNGTAVEGAVEMLNEEVAYEGSNESFVSKVRFNAVHPFTEPEVTLLVSNRVKSYAGIQMQDNHQQTLTVEHEIKQIVCDSVITVGYGNASTLTISVLPASASKGKMLTVKTSSSMILGIETEQVTIGNDGKTEITVNGELPGTAALTFCVEGTDKTAMTIANVEQRVIKTAAMPKASIASGSLIEKGTAITLTCETEGSTIYYTMDGTCPCDETGSRKVYDGTPIIINESVTIKAMAVAPDMYESEVAEFVYIVDGTNIDDISVNEQLHIYPLPVRDKVNISAGGKIIKNVTISSMNGVVVASSNKNAATVTLDVSRIPTGIYITNVTTVDNKFSRKILKLE